MQLSEQIVEQGDRFIRIAQRFWHHAAIWSGEGDTDFRQHAAVAAYFAFLELGGNPAAPSTFDWDASEYRCRALRILRQYVRGRNSQAADILARNALRRISSVNAPGRWDSWKELDDSQVRARTSAWGQSRRTAADLPTSALHVADLECPPERTCDQQTLAEQLMAQLQQILSARELEWLLLRYRDGVDQQTIARQLMASEPTRYSSEDALDRAINRVNVTICRARKKAREALSDRWASVAAEVFAA